MAGKAGNNLEKTLARWRQDQARLQSVKKDAASERSQKPAPKREPKPKGGARGARGRSRSVAGAANPADAAAEPAATTKAFLQKAMPQKAAATVVPLAKQLKDALELLEATRAPVAPAAIAAQYGHDAGPGSALLAALRDSAKAAELPDGRFEYKATHALADRGALLAFLRRSSTGVALADVRDAYAGLEADVAELRATGALWALPGPEAGDVTLFAADEAPLISASAEVAMLWHAVEVPADPDQLLDELGKAGLAPAQRRGSRKRVPPPPKEKRKRPRQLRHVTNQHMPWLFNTASVPPMQID